MTHQPPYHPGQPLPGPIAPAAARPGWFGRLPAGQRVGVVLGGVLLSSVLLCCSGVAVLGAFVDEPPAARKATAGAGSGDAPAAAAEPVVSDGAPQASDGPSAASEPSPVPTTASPSPTPAAPTVSPTSAAPAMETRTETKTQAIRHGERTVKDSSLAEGKRVVRTRGVDGVRTLTYEVTLTDGVPTARTLVRSIVTKQPVTQVVAVGTKQQRRCDPNYSGCVPIASDVDCAGGGGNGPAYVTGPVKVIGVDIYDLDRDNDGYGCDD
ncbi:G5 domain-containing protein [Micromonospora okii]|uniref:G5 domain-containing protein n=1 Tax=Micromonospora okii TaxID=1182970 RepID=UPI001E4CA0CC|nr:G5 domain-containing protein [Micromonospora okii]